MGFLKRSWRALHKGRVWILGALAIALCAWIVGGSESYQSCREGERTDFQDAAFHKAVFHRTAAPAAPDQSDTGVEACLDYFLEENEPGIAALSVLLTTLFTGVLAVSTIGLWRSTKNLHEETRRLAMLAEAQSRDMRVGISVPEQASANAEQSSAGLHDASARSLVPPDI
jgi:hypothetical protein